MARGNTCCLALHVTDENSLLGPAAAQSEGAEPIRYPDQTRHYQRPRLQRVHLRERQITVERSRREPYVQMGTVGARLRDRGYGTVSDELRFLIAFLNRDLHVHLLSL